jgi:hypothetical protein
MKRILLSVGAIIMVAGAVVFAKIQTSGENKVCPARPGCICSKSVSGASIQKQPISKIKKEVCPNRPGCICN